MMRDRLLVVSAGVLAVVVPALVFPSCGRPVGDSVSAGGSATVGAAPGTTRAVDIADAIAALAAIPPADRGAGAARLIAPLSGSIAGSRRPTFRWTGPRAVVIEICADRACTRPMEAFVAVGGAAAVGPSARPASPLPVGVVFWRARWLGAAPMAAATATWELFIVGGNRDSGDDSDDQAAARANRGLRYDVNADGFADLAVRAQNGNAATDAVTVFIGGSGGLATDTAATLPLDTTRFGIDMVAAGDVNGDGYGDLAVADGRGIVVFAGGAGGIGADPLAILPPPSDANPFGFGFQLSAPGDVNGDGYADIVVAEGFKQMWLYSGGPAGPRATPSWVLDRRAVLDRYARLLTAADLNGDGYGDVAITDYGSDGYPEGFRIFRGGQQGLQAPDSGTFVERPAFPSGNAGDVNGDGISDLVTAEGATLALFLGGASFPSASPAAVTPLATRPGAIQIGDFDGDGSFDLAATMSTPTASFYFTDDRIDVYRGGPSGLATVPTATLVETALLPDNQLNFGGSLGNADFDGDGREDLAAGASPPYPTPYFDDSASAVFVFRGSASGIAAAPTPRLDGTPGFGLRVSAGAP